MTHETYGVVKKGGLLTCRRTMPPRSRNPPKTIRKKKTITPQYRSIQPVFLTVFTGVFSPLWTLYSYPQPFGEQNKPPNKKNKEQEQQTKNKNNKQRTRTTNKEQEQQTKEQERQKKNKNNKQRTRTTNKA